MQDRLKHSLKMVNYTAIAAITLLLAGTVAFGVYPMYKDGKEAIAATAEKQVSLKRLEEIHNDVNRATQEVLAPTQRLQDAEKRLPSGPPDNQFNKELTEVAKASGVKVSSTPPFSAPKVEGGYKSVQVSIVGTGDWDNCYKFLAGIRGMNRISRLDSVVMEIMDRDPRARASDKPLCSITVKFSTFYVEH